jgi:hypothetical protein
VVPLNNTPVITYVSINLHQLPTQHLQPIHPPVTATSSPAQSAGTSWS